MRPRLIMGIVEAKYPTQSAGHQCATLSWLEAFRHLGWDVWIVEELASDQCQSAAGRPTSPAESVQVAAWRSFVRAHGFQDRETLFIDGKSPREPEFQQFARKADLFLNYSGQFQALHRLGSCPKVYLDVDPGYTQTWAYEYGCAMNFEGHDHFVTLGLGLGRSDSPIPTCGRSWIPTCPPASTRFFSSVARRRLPGPWTTVAHWYAGSEVSLRDLVLRPKSHSFAELAGLPELARRPMEVACDLSPDDPDFRMLRDRGWGFHPGAEVCGSIANYGAFIAASAGEIGIAKAGYVATLSGWISDRSLVYLACGRPVVAMDTGWKAFVPESEGFRAFKTAEEAAACIAEIESDYPEACRAARAQAEMFAGTRIVAQLLEMLDLASLAIPPERMFPSMPVLAA